MALVNGQNYDHIDLQAVSQGDITRHMIQDTAGRAMIAPNEATSTAASAHAVGAFFTYNDLLYRATADIAVGDTITPNTNCVAVTVGLETSELKGAIEVLEPTATDADVGKALIAKTVADGKVTEYEFGEAGGGGDSSDKAPAIYEDASGAIASFDDGAEDMLLKACVAQIKFVQAGSGDPSPLNVRPITAYSGMSVTNSGKNMFNPNTAGREHTTEQNTIVTGDTNRSVRVPAIPGVSYTLSVTRITSGGTIAIAALNNSGDVIQRSATSTFNSVSITAGENAVTILASYTNADRFGNVQLEFGSAATDYVAYTGSTHTVSWQSTAGMVYEGYADLVNGKLTVTRAGLIYNGQFTLNMQASYIYDNYCRTYFSPSAQGLPSVAGITTSICNMALRNGPSDMGSSDIRFTTKTNEINIYTGNALTGVVAGTDTKDTALAKIMAYYEAHPIQIVYEITPQVYDIDPVIIRTVAVGHSNHVWADTGDISLTYPADTKLYIDGISAANEAMIAKSVIDSGKYFMVNNQLYLSTASIAQGAMIIPGTNCTKTNLVEALNALM